ncbi:MAG TPA: nucleotide excision repair endonuclease [Vicinamibacterales bacterium]|nr:nucleotide excision repair endonuclease [Vicinamibacterales bacterium]
MSRRLFDTKFGTALVESLPAGPGVYLFHDGQGGVLYVGKAKNLRRRLQHYRNAGRRRVHRKMRRLVRDAASLEVRPLASEREALLEENALIRALRPPHNVDGAFAFLYPAIGLGHHDGHVLLCFSTRPDDYATLGLQWFGTFRSRPRAREAFDALIELLTLVGHASRRAQLPPHPSVRGSRLVGLRQLPRALADRLAPFVGGENRALLPALATDRAPGQATSLPRRGICRRLPAAARFILRGRYAPAAAGPRPSRAAGHVRAAGRARRAVHRRALRRQAAGY